MHVTPCTRFWDERGGVQSEKGTDGTVIMTMYSTVTYRRVPVKLCSVLCEYNSAYSTISNTVRLLNTHTKHFWPFVDCRILYSTVPRLLSAVYYVFCAISALCCPGRYRSRPPYSTVDSDQVTEQSFSRCCNTRYYCRHYTTGTVYTYSAVQRSVTRQTTSQDTGRILTAKQQHDTYTNAAIVSSSSLLYQ